MPDGFDDAGGSARWTSSTAPSSYSLPVKKSVRDREGIDDGDRVTVRLDVAS
ncbi:DUF1905 domain-containing protein [Pseudonocardia cypriaca]|uniref:DUF1905 domain-containing protein n=1 Tax=Pseudonocardia cypriaca TaxID=882449 RepID=UPI003CCC6CE0